MSDGPWNNYNKAADEQSGGKPWEKYGGAQPAPPPAEPTVGAWEDVGKGIVGGFGRGVTGLAGTFGTLGDLTRAGLTKAGVAPETIDTGANIIRHIPQLGAFTGPSGSDIQKKVEQYTGKFYEPQTIPGQYASTVAEFAPGALIPGGGAGSVARTIGAKTVNTVVPAVTSETMGQLTKDTAAEPWARAVGGLGGGLAGSKLITPIGPAEGAYQRAVSTLEKEGIPLTAGQRTGSKGLQYIESTAADMPLIGGQAKRMQQNASSGLDRAVTEKIYDRGELSARGVPADVHLPDPRVAKAGPQSLSDNYTTLTQADFASNQAFQNRMSAAQAEYERLVQPHKRSANIENTRNDITDRLVAGQGKMAGDEYQAARSQVADDIRSATNSKEKAALIEFKKALDEAYMSGLSPQEAAALAANNRRYALMKQTQPAVDTATENLSPAKLAASVRSGRGAQYSARAGDLDELAAAAKTVMTPLPNSGTAARVGQAGMGGVGAYLGSMFGPAGTVAGAALPYAIPYAATSRIGQAYLGNQALPQSARDVIAQLMAEQAASQPSGVERNKRERIRVPVYKE